MKQQLYHPGNFPANLAPINQTRSTPPKPLLEQTIYEALVTAWNTHGLDSGLTVEILPILAQALEPIIARYLTHYHAFPDLNTFRAMVNNFSQDGPLVQALLNYNSSEAAALWQELYQKLINQTRQQWPELDAHYQDKIVGETYLRIYRYLPDFLFKSRLHTWIFTILKNEYLRLKDKIKAEQKQKLSLDDKIGPGLSSNDCLASSTPGPPEIMARQQALDDFWQRLLKLRDQLDIKILRLHLEGYNQLEIQQQIGCVRSISAISRRIDRLLKLLRTDEGIREIVRRLGILSVIEDE